MGSKPLATEGKKICMPFGIQEWSLPTSTPTSMVTSRAGHHRWSTRSIPGLTNPKRLAGSVALPTGPRLNEMLSTTWRIFLRHNRHTSKSRHWILTAPSYGPQSRICTIVCVDGVIFYFSGSATDEGHCISQTCSITTKARICVVALIMRPTSKSWVISAMILWTSFDTFSDQWANRETGLPSRGLAQCYRYWIDWSVR